MSLLAMAGIAAAGEAIKWGVNRYNESKRPKFKDSAYAKEMLRRKKEGIYSPEAMNQMQGDANRQYGSSAETGRARYMGNLVAQDMGGSIAAQRGANQFGIDAARAKSNFAGELSTENEMSKITAADQYNQALYQDKQQSWQNKSQANQQLVGGLTDAATGYFAGKIKADGSQYKVPANLGQMTGVQLFEEARNMGGDPQQNLLQLLALKRQMASGGQQYLQPVGQGMTGGL